MKTSDACPTCPLRGDHDLIPDQLVRLAPVLILQDRPGDPPIPRANLTAAKLKPGQNVSFGHALRCEGARKILMKGKKYEAALAACRAHDDFTGVSAIVVTSKVGWQALGLADWGLNRGYAREVK